MLKAIRKFFGLTEKTNKTGEIPTEALDHLSRFMEEFNNRPIYKTLTAEIIDATADENLLQVIFDNLSEKINGAYEKEYEIVTMWNKSRQAFYMIWLLESEVNNGGYNQFFYNSSGQFYQHLPDALRLIGAVKFEDLTQKAIDIYEAQHNQITQHHDGTLEGFSRSYDENPLNELDSIFYELNAQESIEKIQIKYIREHKVDFLDE